ncbi:hypothetical protein ORI89_04065 [Sphingobacterium sp. UT-1RO-CII-1]|uniref:hypothetical protein n=1 Tax=Sphingobacterium sp. UT-1RO-CII-1 TaxID=2995225 RepID=UPI00227C7EFC|nr:hypothetical protein [Sphingobacterium sp. UT-1RO-CII-1]MCY4778815.1 hypothetical protein [Sphingobacterium sp. UT-1RO-CII-1]
MMRFLRKGECYALSEPRKKRYYLSINSFQCLLLSLSAIYYQFSCNVQKSRARGTTGYAVDRDNRVRGALAIKERLLRIARSDGKVLLTIFCVLFNFASIVEAKAQELRPGGATVATEECLISKGASYNHSLLKNVRSIPLMSKKYYNEAIKRYPKADLYKYPMARYDIDEEKIPWLKDGDLLPEEVLDLPLWVVNDQYGRDTITLRSEMDKKWIIIHSWFESCPPCVHGMKRWETLATAEAEHFNLIGVFTSLYPHRAAFESRRFGWQSPQVIGESMQILRTALARNHYSSGSTIWIKNGRVFGSSGIKLTEEEKVKILHGELNHIPEHAKWVMR